MIISHIWSRGSMFIALSFFFFFFAFHFGSALCISSSFNANDHETINRRGMCSYVSPIPLNNWPRDYLVWPEQSSFASDHATMDILKNGNSVPLIRLLASIPFWNKLNPCNHQGCRRPNFPAWQRVESPNVAGAAPPATPRPPCLSLTETTRVCHLPYTLALLSQCPLTTPTAKEARP